MTPGIGNQAKTILAYDSDCGPCTRFKNAISFLDARRRLGFKSLMAADRQGMLDSVPLGRRHRSFHLIGPDGIVSSGANALPGLVGLLPGGTVPSKAIASSPLLFRGVSFVYTVLSRLHDSGSCTFTERVGVVTRPTRERQFGASLRLGAIANI